MKILTWNINGIRASKVKLEDLFKSLQADIICLQETKVTRDQLDEPSAIVDGFNSYFSFSKGRSGYSGVATFVRDSMTPVKAEEGLTGLLASGSDSEIGCYGDTSSFTGEELVSLDNEGRAIITQHKIMCEDKQEELLTVINVYCPNADPENEDRKMFKIKFYNLLQSRAEAILASGSHVIVLGDVNASHKQVDHCDPSEDFDNNRSRHWLNNFLLDPEKEESNQSAEMASDLDSSFIQSEGHQFIDSFRHFYPSKTHAFTCWNTMRSARLTNYGTRIDYIFGDEHLVKDTFSDCIIMAEVEGSDHCPVKATLSSSCIPATKCPSICTKYLPEFTGRQQKLFSFFKTNGTKAEKTSSECGRLKSKAKDAEIVKDMIKPTKPTCDPTTLKRSSSEPTSFLKSSGKKAKTSNTSAKQATLAGFFGKKSSIQGPRGDETHTSVAHKISTGEGNSAQIQPDKSSKSACHPITTQPASVSSNKSKETASSAWKNLLRGPPPPPMCKGHTEPCVLRTVKKDGLNKGRQFWVCDRPDGHKTNPAARCDTFIWIDKKKS